MPDVGWRQFSKIDPDGEYLMFLSYLPLDNYWHLPKMLSYTLKVMSQLTNSPGLVGYALRSHLLRLQFFTLSAWESERALMEFAQKMPHKGTMRALHLDLIESHFVQWKAKGSEIPVKWDDALGRLRSAD